MLTRRGFIIGALAAPFVARLGLLMPVREAQYGFMRGDLAHGSFAGARVVDRVEGRKVFLWNNAYGSHRLSEPFQASKVELFHGLPGNRVNNPSMQHRLVRAPNEIGFRYAGEAAYGEHCRGKGDGWS